MNVEDLIFKVILRFKVVHSIPGRIRIHIPMSRKIPREWKQTLENLDRLKNFEGIREVNFSVITGNALIYYDPEKISDKQIIDTLRQIAKVLNNHRRELSRRADQDQNQALEYLLNLLKVHIPWPKSTDMDSTRSQ